MRLRSMASVEEARGFLTHPSQGIDLCRHHPTVRRLSTCTWAQAGLHAQSHLCLVRRQVLPRHLAFCDRSLWRIRQCLCGRHRLPARMLLRSTESMVMFGMVCLKEYLGYTSVKFILLLLLLLVLPLLLVVCCCWCCCSCCRLFCSCCHLFKLSDPYAYALE